MTVALDIKTQQAASSASRNGQQTLHIASQLDAAFNQQLTAGLLHDMGRKLHVSAFSPQALFDLSEQEVLLVTPQRWPKEKPAGWPFQLKWIQLASSGIDFYPKWLFEGVRVTTSRGATSLPIVEFVLAALFRQYKQLDTAQIHVSAHWQRRNVPLLAGSTLGIVGYGSIGQLLATYARALGIRVLVLKRHDSAVDGIEQVHDINNLIAQVDHLVLAAPATPETHHLINASSLQHAKPGLHLINIARGSLIQQDDLMAALDSGLLSHATLDVTTPEPLPAGHALYQHPKVTITPHTSATAITVLPAVLEQFKDNLLRYLNDEPLLNQVDVSRGY
jgi:phosphoglycerate dehydrogenase-like enzyme